MIPRDPAEGGPPPEPTSPDPAGPRRLPVPTDADGVARTSAAAGPPVAPPGGPPAASTFSLDGRAAPALYLGGWVLSVSGLGLLVVAIMSGGLGASPWLFAIALGILGVGLVAAAGSQAIDRSRRPDVAFHGPSPWLTFAAAVALIPLAFIGVVAPLTAFGLDPASPAAAAIGISLSALIYIGLLRLLVVGTGALTWREMGLGQPLPTMLREFAIGALLALPILLVTGYLGLALSTVLDRAPSPLPEAVDTTGLLLNALTAIVLAPIGEELFFRGYATTAWERGAGRRQAILRGALLFSLAHIITIFDAEQALTAFLIRLPIGLALGWLFLTRRSLAAAIGLHAAFNGIQILALASVSAPG